MKRKRKEKPISESEWAVEMEEALARTDAQFDRAVWYLCAWGRCSQQYDPVDGEILGGMGPMGCPCDHLPGWSAKHPDQMAKPRFEVKVMGRNGSRVARSVRRHAGVEIIEGGQWMGFMRKLIE